MHLQLPLRSAAIIRWPLKLEVTLDIHPDRVASGMTVGLVALRLIEMGGQLSAWQPSFYDLPAVARFSFPTPHERDRFMTQALEIAGVSESPPSMD